MLKKQVLALMVIFVLAATGIRPARAAAGTITVTGTADNTTTNLNGNGTCDLREALENANAGNGAWTDCAASTGGPDTIVFNIPGAGIHMITVAALLPVGQNDLVIDGTTQPGYAGAPLIRLNGDGTDTTAPTFDLLSVASSNVTIKGLILTNGVSGVKVNSTADSTIIQANYIGTLGVDATWMGNLHGLYLASATNTLIGGTGAGQGNLISGNQDGAWIQGNSTGTMVWGNRIGTNSAGTASISNSYGMFVNSSGASTVGGPGAGEGNLISGNFYGVFVLNTRGDAVVIQGNRIGTDPGGFAAVPNATGIVTGNAQNVLIGGASQSAGNLIAHHSTTSYPAVALTDSTSTLAAGSSNNCLIDNLLAVDRGTSTAVTLENNWWGDASGPLNATSNPSGLGNPVSDNVDFDPFLTTPPSACSFLYAPPITAPGPVLTRPKNGASAKVGKKVVFKWKKIKTATQYEFQLADAATGFGSPLATGPATKPMFPYSGLGYGAYLWRVRVSAGSETLFSPERALFVTIMKAPGYGKTLKHTPFPKFKWSKFPGAGSYTLRVSDSPTCSSALHDYPLLTKTSLKVPDALPGGTHYWQVTPDNGPAMPCWPFTLQ